LSVGDVPHLAGGVVEGDEQAVPRGIESDGGGDADGGEVEQHAA
jgi:hypothetical protein